jgi:hypothetical protein
MFRMPGNQVVAPAPIGLSSTQTNQRCGGLCSKLSYRRLLAHVLFARRRWSLAWVVLRSGSHQISRVRDSVQAEAFCAHLRPSQARIRDSKRCAPGAVAVTAVAINRCRGLSPDAALPTDEPQVQARLSFPCRPTGRQQPLSGRAAIPKALLSHRDPNAIIAAVGDQCWIPSTGFPSEGSLEVQCEQGNRRG